MAFTKKTWVDRLVEFAGRRKITNVSTLQAQIVDVERVEGVVSQEGSAFSAANMNDLEQRIADGIAGVERSVNQVSSDLANKASKDHTHDASKVTGTFLDKTFRWLLGDGNSSSDYAELRKSGASPDFGLSFVFHDTSANTNTFYGVFDKSGKFQLATKDSVDKLSNKASSLESTVSELDGAACKAYHWTNGNESSAPYYKSLNIKYSGGTFGTR